MLLARDRHGGADLRALDLAESPEEDVPELEPIGS
jgi:hypothetical protein